MSRSLRRYLASKLANQGEELSVGTLWVKLFISPLPIELQKQLKKSNWDLRALKAGLFLASGMTSLARLLQVDQGATEILGQHPLEDPWCCGAGRTWAQSQLSVTPQAPMQNPQGRQRSLQPVKSQLGSSALQKRWTQSMSTVLSGFRREWLVHFYIPSRWRSLLDYLKALYNTLNSAGSIFETLPSSLSWSLVGCGLLLSLSVQVGVQDFKKCRGLPFPFGVPFTWLLKMFFRLCPSWKLCV